VRDMREKTVVIVVRYHPLQQETPALLRSARKTQALEGHGHHRHVTLPRHPAPRIPDRVPRRVIAIVVSPYVVELDARGIGHEAVGATLIIEGVEIKLHLIVLRANVLAARHARAHLLGIAVEANKNSVK